MCLILVSYILLFIFMVNNIYFNLTDIFELSSIDESVGNIGKKRKICQCDERKIKRMRGGEYNAYNCPTSS